MAIRLLCIPSLFFSALLPLATMADDQNPNVQPSLVQAGTDTSIDKRVGREHSTDKTGGASLDAHSSPYLRAHADDPIGWIAVDDSRLEARLDENRRQLQRPILISSGYQSCYWCYRMKTDTFSDKKLANTINRHFIPILADRELHPALDNLLQDFMNDQRGFGGWPVTVLLTPNTDPVLGFGYSDSSQVRRVLDSFLERWLQEPERIKKLASASAKAREMSRQQKAVLLKKVMPGDLLKELLAQVSASADEKNGGFGDKPKFPHLPQLAALLNLYQINPDQNLGRFIQTSLDAMLNGALRDAVGGGFFRYTDLANWREPHFEQMLYTQSMMISLLIRSASAFSQPRYLSAASEALDNLLSRFHRKDGFFHAALAAFSEPDKKSKQQKVQSGAYYLWTPAQLSQLLGVDWPKKVTNLRSTDQTKSDTLVLPAIRKGAHYSSSKATLLTARNQRNAPPADDKLIPAWQGLTLSALSYAASMMQSGQTGTQKSDPHRHPATHVSRVTKQLADQLLLSSQAALTADDKTDRPLTLSSLADYVYVAQGLIDWWQLSANDVYQITAGNLLLEAHRLFYTDGRWHETTQTGLLRSNGAVALPDTQLPSASALWLTLADAINLLQGEALEESADNNGSELASLVEEQASRLTLDVRDNAFFHATLISVLVARQIRHNSHKKETSFRLIFREYRNAS